LLSTLVKEGALQEDLITTNIKKINDAIGECRYLIDRYKITEVKDINPETHRQCLVDYKVDLYPTTVFQEEQYRVNVHHKNIREYRLNGEGQPVIKPMVDQYPGRSGKLLFD
jgi:hypothetical protein